MQIENLDEIDRVLLIELQNLPFEEFIFFQAFHETNSFSKAATGDSSSAAICLDHLCERLGVTNDEVYRFISDPTLNLRSKVSVTDDEGDYFGVSGLTHRWHLIEEKNYVSVGTTSFKDMPLFQAIRLSRDANDKENFRRRSYKTQDSLGKTVKYKKINNRKNKCQEV